MKLSRSLIALLLITLIGGCKQDFDITSTYKELPVVYGLLNQKENVHYIRIQKGYLIDGNANVAAGVADSIYYSDSLIVKLIPYYNGAINGSTILLHKVDGNLIGLPKDSGLFANSPNILYATDNNTHLIDNRIYRLQVIRKVDTKSDTLVLAETSLVRDFSIHTPGYGAKLNLQDVSPQKIVWDLAENSGIYDLNIRFFYTEFRMSDNSLYRDTFIDVPFFTSRLKDYTAGGFDETEFTASGLLTYMAANIKADEEVYRQFNLLKGMQFKFAVGGSALDSFYISKFAQSGLASNEALPPYSNINRGRGIGGAGLLSSRYFKEVDSVLLSNNGLDTLACSAISHSLRFKNHNGAFCQ